jgi:LmbE family N-acetylglucosaminyl deacetylase
VRIGSRSRTTKASFILLLFALGTGAVRAGAAPRPPDALHAAELSLALKKLRVLGSVLYVAAHPDDENTALITYLESDRLVRVGYLSMTRGSGGQNLIGRETGEALGVIRTQELLAARALDGAEQYFTRAIDFGYSKSAEETMEIWGRDAILSDVVWVIRKFRPDVIVTRFPPDGRGGHGHHQASAILAKEAFEAAADPTRFPDQLERVRPWRATRVLWNVFRVDPATRDPALPKLLILDLGAFNPLLGRSYTELSAASRSMHKSQGFGAAERRGPVPNYLEPLAGDAAPSDLLDGIVTGWARIRGGKNVDAILAEAERRLDPAAPHAIIPILVRAHAALRELGDDPWVAIKRQELEAVMRSCAGLWIEAIAARPWVSPGGEIPVALSILSRSGAPVTIVGASVPGAPGAFRDLEDRALAKNVPAEGNADIPIPGDASITQPYWLREPSEKGTNVVRDRSLLGLAENPSALSVAVDLDVSGARITYVAPVAYRWTDRVLGERYRSLGIVPPATLRLDRKAYLFPDSRAREVRVLVESMGGPVTGIVRLELPDGWTATPSETTISLDARAPAAARFRVSPAAETGAARVAASITIAGVRHASSREEIDYPHVPATDLFPPAEARLVRADVRRAGTAVGYVEGSGDEIPAALEEMGYRVTPLGDDEIESGSLSGFDAIVIGIRAYNTRPRLVALRDRLLRYVEGGGVLVVQYNTVEESLDDRIGPFPFRISRDRVTVEEARVRFPNPAHDLLRKPNRIDARDFDGWVQERGLYFAGPWDAKYETVLSMNDPGEKPMEGSLLYARHGNGVFIYTGLSWFRQLPAGVPGAYRLFANLVSGGRE